MVSMIPEYVAQVVELEVLVTSPSGKAFRPKLLIKFDPFSRTVKSMEPADFQFTGDLGQDDGSHDR